MQTGLDVIANERYRQLTVEGFTPEHDDEHAEGELARAAAAYAVADALRKCSPPGAENIVPGYWPWSEDWWKPLPDDRIRELAKAGALIVAEIERLQRLGSN